MLLINNKLRLNRIQKSVQLSFIFAIMGLIGCESSQSVLKLLSPDETIAVSINLREIQGMTGSQGIHYSITYHGREIVRPSPIYLELKNDAPIGNQVTIENQYTRAEHNTWERVWGRSKKVTNLFNEITVETKETIPPHRKMHFTFRAYNEGVAFRYILPKENGMETLKISKENTIFNLPQAQNIWAVNYGGYASHQESEYEEHSIAEIQGDIIGMPLLIQLSNDQWAAISEANLTDWAGMYLSGASDSTLVTQLSPRVDEPDVLVHVTNRRKSPWRVIMLGKSPGSFLEYNLIHNLCEPSALEDVSWIRPGKSAWDWWWCNGYAPDVDFTPGPNTETMKYFIDFASEMGWEYQLVDWNWYGPPFDPDKEGNAPHPTSDILTENPDINIPELVTYAAEKNVRLLLWLEWNHADKQMEEAFPLYEKWGIAGVKVDFMARDDQEMVNFYHRLVKKAAEHHLTVDFHGAYKPTGWSRTYPNLLTREGVLGNEYTKWSDRITPEHNVTVAFTRGMLGEMDFTPGAFVNVTKENFKTEEDGTSPMVMNSRCHQLAMLVVFESALAVLCDSPFNYLNSPAGLEFLKSVPTTWDETRYLDGEVGKFIAVARRSGDTWYVGCMNGWDARSLELNLDFLADGIYQVKIWKDGKNANDDPESVEMEDMELDKNKVVKAKLAKGGGMVLQLTLK